MNEAFRPQEWIGSGRLWSLWDMLRTYLPLYQVALSLQSLRSMALVFKDSGYRNAEPSEIKRCETLLGEVHRVCSEYGFEYTADMAKRAIEKGTPQTHNDIFGVLEHLNDSLSYELGREAIVRIPEELKSFFEADDLFGPKVSDAFPSCKRDIQKAGTCYALGQEDACVHHLMLVLERGLNALAARVGVTYQRANWQEIINQIGAQLKTMPRGARRDFYLEVNAQFGFLKDAYRNHSEHARDDHYDMPKALSILNHVRDFMQAIEKDGLKE
jgi:hypothetical protein